MKKFFLNTTSTAGSRIIDITILCVILLVAVFVFFLNGSCNAQNMKVRAGLANTALTRHHLYAVSDTPAIKYNSCCPPWNADILKKSLFYKGTGSIADPYTLVFKPDILYQNQMQAYLNYLHSVNNAITTIAIEFRLHNQGNGVLPSTSGWGAMVGNIGYCSYTWNTTGISSLSPVPPINFWASNSMVIDNWYAIPTGIYLNNNLQFFSKECADNGIYVRIQVMNAKPFNGTGGENAQVMLEVSDGHQITGSIPIKMLP